MNQVFISYRHASPDEALAEGLDRYLCAQGLPVFVDKRIQVGLDWVQEIDLQLRSSKYLVVLLSEHSIRSDMVRQEVKIAHELRREGRMIILPVRVAFEEVLPYDLASYLDRIQHIGWKPGDSEQDLFARLFAAIRAGEPLPESSADGKDATVISLQRNVSRAEADGAPLPAAEPRIVMETGTIRLDSRFYVRRRDDSIMERYIVLQGSTVIVKGPRQSGKSSMLARAHALARRSGLQSVYLDFQLFDEPQLASLQSLLQTLAGQIGLALRSTLRPAEVWDSLLLGDKTSFSTFLERALLAGTTSPVVLLLDEVDRVFNHPYRADFFAAVRGWHNNRATKDEWINLNLVLGHSTDPTLWIPDLNESPFNVGQRIRLMDFTRAEVEDLNGRHGFPLRHPREIESLMHLLGGHPYLIRQALYVLATESMSLEEIRAVAPRDDGPFGDHLRRHLWALYQSDRLQDAVKRILRDGSCDDEGLFQRLLSVGLVMGETRAEAHLRCNLYQEYFFRHL